MDSSSDIQHELDEANLEIARHHQAFEKISELCDVGLKNVFNKGIPTPVDALKQIRNIIG